MPQGPQVNVRVFGVLREFQLRRDLPCEQSVPLPEGGCSASRLASAMGLPVEGIEGVFCNHTIFGLDHPVRPGDEVAFVPYGTPGPHRFFLGLYKAGHADR